MGISSHHSKPGERRSEQDRDEGAFYQAMSLKILSNALP
jgi:hypothetical protein